MPLRYRCFDDHLLLRQDIHTLRDRTATYQKLTIGNKKYDYEMMVYLLFLFDQAIPLAQLIKLSLKSVLVCFQLLQAQSGAAFCSRRLILKVGEVDRRLNGCQRAHEIIPVGKLVQTVSLSRGTTVGLAIGQWVVISWCSFAWIGKDEALADGLRLLLKHI